MFLCLHLVLLASTGRKAGEMAAGAICSKKFHPEGAPSIELCLHRLKGGCHDTSR